MVEALESVRRFIWHGNVGRALGLVEDLGDAVDLFDDPPTGIRKFRRHLDEFSGYIPATPG